MNTDEQILIYQAEDGQTRLEVQLQEETVWLTQKQIAELFGTQRPAVTKHLSNIFKTKELDEEAVCSILEHTASDGKKYKTQFYNLDTIIAIGYRINSKKATQFRIWANQIIRNYLVKGYAFNKKRLTETQNQLHEVTANLKLLGRIVNQKALTSSENEAFLTLITDYANALELLDQYDHQQIEDIMSKTNTIYKITLEDAMLALKNLKTQSGASELFAKPKDKSFDSSLSTIFQTFEGRELYPSLEDKAAHLLYFVVKNHSFIDGNKRIGAFLFIWFLSKNNALTNENGLQRINNETLVALTILIAESKPQEKDLIIKLIKHLIKTSE